MNTTLKIVISICIICASMSGCVTENEDGFSQEGFHAEILAAVAEERIAPVVEPEPEDEWIREYTNLPLQWLGGVDFTVNGTIEFKDDRYYIKCKGVDDTNYYLLRFNGYADRVDVKITDKYLRNYYGDTDLRDHKILKAMIKESKPIK